MLPLIAGHDAVLALLSRRDAMALLATARPLREDAALVGRVRRRYFPHLFQRCVRDASVTRPRVCWGYACGGGDHNASQLIPQEASASLLSLAGLLETRLAVVVPLYRGLSDGLSTTQVLPFLRPVPVASVSKPSSTGTTLNALQERVDASAFGFSPRATLLGLHWENMEVQRSDGGDLVVVCRFCDMVKREVERLKRDGRAHWESRETQIQRIRDEIQDDNALAWRLRELEEFEREADTLYDPSLQDGAAEEIVMRLLEMHKLPLLQLMTAATPDCVGRAASDGITKTLCPNVYRPLFQFVHANGFTDVQRLRTTLFDGSDELPRSEIASVELIGGVTPHGFVAGVYVIELFG